jgi:hypothetical protein
MEKVRAVLGYIAAALAIPLMLGMFVLLIGGNLDQMVLQATGLTLSPLIDGGAVARTIDHGAYQTQVHQMVFSALIGESKKGSIQLDWAPLEALPVSIDEEIDADGDGKVDFRVQVDTANLQSTLTLYAPWVIELEGTYERKASLAVLVRLENPARQKASSNTGSSH